MPDKKETHPGHIANINFKLEKATSGAYKFYEVDEAGNKKGVADGAVVGTLYVRKAALPAGVTPTGVSVDLDLT